MFSHVFIGVSDFERAHAFYVALFAALPAARAPQLKLLDPDRGWAVWKDADRDRPLLIVGKPENGAPHRPGNGQMTAFLAESRAAVDAGWRAALAAGGSDEGAPGLRPQYHPHYYGAYFRDPDGNKLCVACHRPED